MRWILFIVAFVLGCGMMQFFLGRQNTNAPRNNTQALDPKNTDQKSGPSAARYVPPAGLNVEMQAFEKAVLFLLDRQEPDGHWSAKKNGSAPEFQNENGDIALTSLATYTLLLTARGKNVNRYAVARAKKGMEWLNAKLQPDGRVAAVDQPGGPVVAQLMAGMAFLQSATMSTRTELKQSGTRVVRYGIMEMASPEGGWGPTPKSKEIHADISALGVFVYRSGLLEDVKFTDAKERDKIRKVETDIENSIKAGMNRLLTKPEANLEKKKDSTEPDDPLRGVYGARSDAREADWDATVGGLLGQVLMLVPPSKTQATVKFVFGELDKTTNRFPLIQQKMAWGEKGEGYRSQTLWLNTMAVIYLFGEQTFEFKTWSDIAKKDILEKQRADGGWDVAGEDAKRGEIWRAGMQAMAITLIAPQPPPPADPSTDPNGATAEPGN